METGGTNPLSGVVPLGSVFESTAALSWKAGTPGATGFTFHGVSTESASLSESATRSNTAFGWGFDVNSFNLTSHSSDSGHVTDDEPSVPVSGTGTESFHRDETFTGTNDVSGNGSYVGGSASADYHATDVGTYSVANVYTVLGDHTQGYTYEGEPFDLTFNFTRDSAGSGIVSNTHDYHDDGTGLALTGVTFSTVVASTVNSRNWGLQNGVAFDTPSVNVESWSRSVSLPGEVGPVTTPSGLTDTFPLRGMTTPGGLFFVMQPTPPGVPLTPVRGKPGQIQDWYNKKIMAIGEDAKKKVVNVEVKNTVLTLMQDTNGAVFPSGGGTIELDKGGQTFAQGLGLEDDLAKMESHWLQLKSDAKWKDAKIIATPYTLIYAVDQPDKNPRSGNVIVHYRVNLTLSGTLNGQPITQTLDGVRGDLFFHDGKLEKMKLQESP